MIRSTGSRMGSMPIQSHRLGDATGARSGPLATMVLYYKTHLAFPVSGGSSSPTEVSHDSRNELSSKEAVLGGRLETKRCSNMTAGKHAVCNEHDNLIMTGANSIVYCCLSLVVSQTQIDPWNGQ